MKHLQYILVLILISVCSYPSKIVCQDEKSDKTFNEHELPERIRYVSNPRPTDTLCISEIERAKKDLSNGKIVFTQEVGHSFGHIRYENELKQLCEEMGLAYDTHLIGCFYIEGQTKGCYGRYMDKVIIEKFGIDFKEKLHKKADSLYLSNVNSQNITVQYYDCDKWPKLPNEAKRTNDYLPSIKVKNIDIEENKSENGGWPYIDIGFIVEKDGTISGFYMESFNPELEKNEQYKDELYRIAVKHIKKNYPIWIPGKVIGVPVRTDNNVRIYFVKETLSLFKRDVGYELNNLCQEAEALYEAGKHDSAVVVANKALEVAENNFKTNVPDVNILLYLDKLAGLYITLGQNEQAEQIYRQGMAIVEQIH